ncbi:hypothetical protein GCM10017776_14210 [Streptomyces griseoluteus]|nr:hypothetical protein GCM10017776_14210 [Streptomyces griseoluteus]
MAAVISSHCLDISEPKTVRGLEAGYRPYTARWSLSELPARRRPPTPAPNLDRQPTASPGELTAHRLTDQDAGEWEIPRIPLQYERAVLAGVVVREKLRTTTATPPPCGAVRTSSSPTSRRRCPSICSHPSWPTPRSTIRSRSPADARGWT